MGFEAVSQNTWYDFFQNGAGKEYNQEDMPNMEDIEDMVPRRSTTASAGYDFFMPFDFTFEAGKEYVVPTGFKWNPFDSSIMIGDEEIVYDVDRPITMIPKKHSLREFSFLALYPRSSLGFKYGFQLLNTVGIIDADYYNNPDNEGHIMVGMKVAKTLTLKKGDKLCQGVIQPCGICAGEIQPLETRVGGVGSTGN